jgi:tRNA(Ile)-lysidine synthase
MALAPTIQRVSRRDRTVRTVSRAWRELTGGLTRGRDSQRRTLIACSGGADSSGLAIALASAVSKPRMQFVVAHVVHDMRAEDEALADRDATKGLAARLGLEFVESRVRLRGLSGNAEAVARRLRYAALKQLAEDHGCGFIATAHQADDQLETMLMKLIRGAGPRGLAGVAPSRDACEGRADRDQACAGRYAAGP